MKSYNSIKMDSHDEITNDVQPMTVDLSTGGQWVPLIDFAVKRGVSLSTLRRYIKQGKVVFRVEHGRYLLCDDGRFPRAKVHPLQTQVSKLEVELQKAQEEIAELKTLIAFYEDQRPSR
jgi:hypothetical protein